MNHCEATKIIEFDAAHRVPAHKSKCRNLHGHRYRVEATVVGPIKNETGSSDDGMVIDFGDIKQILKEHIHDVYDHGSIFYFADEAMHKTMLFLKDIDPTQNINIVEFVPTAENLARHFYHIVEEHIQAPLVLARIRVYETPTSWADFCGDNPDVVRPQPTVHYVTRGNMKTNCGKPILFTHNTSYTFKEEYTTCPQCDVTLKVTTNV